ncbi:unnamed protein product [Chrysoparadoxa australica]
MEMDPRVSQVDVMTIAGNRVAGSSQLRHIIGRDLMLTVQDTKILLVGRDDAEVAATTTEDAPDLYLKLQRKVLSKGPQALPSAELETLMMEEGVQSAAECNRWKEIMLKDGLLSEVRAGELVVLNPSHSSFRQQLSDRLLHERKVLEVKVSELRAELAEHQQKEEQIRELKKGIEHEWKRHASNGKFLIFTLMSAQLGGLTYLTYQVYAWDVVEPMTYFIMAANTVLGSIYFGARKKDPSWQNIYSLAKHKKQQALAQKKGYSVEEHDELRKVIAKVERTIHDMEQRAGL